MDTHLGRFGSRVWAWEFQTPRLRSDHVSHPFGVGFEAYGNFWQTAAGAKTDTATKCEISDACKHGEGGRNARPLDTCKRRPTVEIPNTPHGLGTYLTNPLPLTNIKPSHLPLRLNIPLHNLYRIPNIWEVRGFNVRGR